MRLDELSEKSISKIFACIGYNPTLVARFRKLAYKINVVSKKKPLLLKTQELRIHYQAQCPYKRNCESIVGTKLRIYEENTFLKKSLQYGPNDYPLFPDATKTFGHGFYGGGTCLYQPGNLPGFFERCVSLLNRIFRETNGTQTFSICKFVVTKQFLDRLGCIVPTTVKNFNFQSCVFKISAEDLTNFIRRFKPTGLCLDGEFEKPIVNDLHVALVSGALKVFNTRLINNIIPSTTFVFSNITDISLQNWYYNNTNMVDLNNQRTNLTFEAVWKFVKKMSSKPNVNNEVKSFDLGKIPTPTMKELLLIQRDKGFNWTVPETGKHIISFTVTHTVTGFVFKFQLEDKYYKNTKGRILAKMNELRKAYADYVRALNVDPTEIFQQYAKLKMEMFDEWTDLHTDFRTVFIV